MALFYSTGGVQVNSAGVARPAKHTTFDDNGYADVDPLETELVEAVEGARSPGARIDRSGTEEALTPGTVQTATTLTALYMRNGAAETTINVRDGSAAGTILLPLLTVAASEQAAFVLPEEITAASGVFLEVVTGALDGTTPGWLIP